MSSRPGYGHNAMSNVTCQISISLDGYVAGPNQSTSNPIGEGGMRLHQWAFATQGWRAQQGVEGGERNADSEVVASLDERTGAYVMGRKMFGPGDGPWDESWKGWWGDEPPYHAPVFVLTHHPREPLEMQGATTFTFVTDGIESALEQARAAAGDGDVAIAGRERGAPVPRGRVARRAVPAHRPRRARRGRAAARGRGRSAARAGRGRCVADGDARALSRRAVGTRARGREANRCCAGAATARRASRRVAPAARSGP